MKCQWFIKYFVLCSKRGTVHTRATIHHIRDSFKQC